MDSKLQKMRTRPRFCVRISKLACETTYVRESTLQISNKLLLAVYSLTIYLAKSMDVVGVLGVISSITGIISFILYFIDKKNTSGQQTPSRQGVSFDDWKIWMVITLLTTVVFVLMSIQKNTGIQGDNNDNNKIIISPQK